jgi:hypothetical protein
MDLLVLSYGVALRLAGGMFSAGDTLDSALCRLPLYRRPRDAALDSLFGPAEKFEYVSTTAPASPPPTR